MELVDWRKADYLTLDEAAYLLSGVDPGPLRQGGKVAESYDPRWLLSLKRSVQARVLPATRVVVKGFGSLGEVNSIPVTTVAPHDVLHTGLTRIAVDKFVAWCLEIQAPIPWPFLDKARGGSHADSYPIELRAAIEAFEAVSANPAAVAGSTPRQALLRWLKEHKPHIGSNARDRIATVANWLPAGGAPKTPGA